MSIAVMNWVWANSPTFRRRILELLVGGEQPAGAVGKAIQQEFGISQPAV